MKKNIFLIILCATVALSLLLGVFHFYGSDIKEEHYRGYREYFKTEENYLNFLQKEVSFDTIDFKFLTVEKGDNFWKIAKNYGVNIDTLIGANIFWEDLVAKEKQVVVVPSEKGRLDFVFSLLDIPKFAQEHGIDIKDIEVQRLPVFYNIITFFQKEKKPVAIFVKDVKPCVENMTPELAGQFVLREKFRSPLGGRFSSFFGNRRHPIYNERRFHNGIDIAAPYGTLIGASRDGVVVSAGWNGPYGKAVVIDHGDGYKTLYGHMSVIYARVGENVKAGKIIGRVGSTGLSTGPHLHFTLWHNEQLINPMKILW